MINIQLNKLFYAAIYIYEADMVSYLKIEQFVSTSKNISLILLYISLIIISMNILLITFFI